MGVAASGSASARRRIAAAVAAGATALAVALAIALAVALAIGAGARPAAAGDDPASEESTPGIGTPYGWIGLKPGTDDFRARLGVFAPLWRRERSLLFLDARAVLGDAEYHEGNVGLGWRQLVGERLLVGGALFYDRLRSARNNTFHQVTLSLEALSRTWDVRLNTYLPLTGKRETGLRLEPTGTGCRGYYTIEATPAGPIGSIILATGFFASVNKMFAKLSQSAERFALGAQDIKFPIAPPRSRFSG